MTKKRFESVVCMVAWTAPGIAIGQVQRSRWRYELGVDWGLWWLPASVWVEGAWLVLFPKTQYSLRGCLGVSDGLLHEYGSSYHDIQFPTREEAELALARWSLCNGG